MSNSTGTQNGAAPVAPLATVAPAPVGKAPRKAAPPAGKAPAGILGKSLDGAAAGTVNFHTVRGVRQTGDGTRLYAVLSDDGRFGYSLRKGGDFLTMAAAGKGWDKGAPFAAPYTVAGIRTVVAMLDSLNGRTANPDQHSAPVTVAGHLPPDVAVKCGLPRVTRVAGARRGTGRSGSI
jgi:hypothetical protein